MWKTEIRKLWRTVGSIAGRRECPEATAIYKSRKGFGYSVRCSTVRPRNLSIQDLLSDDRFTGAVVDFLKDTKVRAVRTDGLERSGPMCGRFSRLDAV